MSGSSYTPRWRRALQKFFPGLFSVCPAGNYHWKGDLLCYCVKGMNGADLAVRDSRRGDWILLKRPRG